MQKKLSGFTAVEVLITITVAAIFLLAFYQLYVAVTQVNARAEWLAKANQVVFAKVQDYESKNFADIPASQVPPIGAVSPCGPNSAIENFTAELQAAVPNSSRGLVCAVQVSPTLKYVLITADYSKTNEKLEYKTYIQATRTD